MKAAFTLAALILSLSCTAFAQTATETGAAAIDFDKAKALIQKQRGGETLSAEESAYLDRAKQLRAKGAAMRPGSDARQRPAAGGDGAQRPAPERLIPLTDLSADERYQDQDGGLYGAGLNSPPAELQKSADAQLAKIQPLDADGKPAADGKVVFISISMSNATQEFSRFKQLADESDQKLSTTVVVDCAQGGQAMAEWVAPDAKTWQVTAQRLNAAGVSPNQVQVAWVKLANKGPRGSLEEHCQKLESDTLKVLQNAKEKFPNLQIAYLGSRIWAGNAKGNLNPEPYAYESAFPVRTLIQRQMKGDAELSLEVAPLLLWGPYLWAEGTKGRAIDDLVWLPGDFAGDGVHPSTSGRQKVAELLLDFVTTDPLAKPWFAGK